MSVAIAPKSARAAAGFAWKKKTDAGARASIALRAAARARRFSVFRVVASRATFLETEHATCIPPESGSGAQESENRRPCWRDEAAMAAATWTRVARRMGIMEL
jgi:hypothetical protein